MENNFKKHLIFILIISIIFSSLFGATFGFLSSMMLQNNKNLKDIIQEISRKNFNHNQQNINDVNQHQEEEKAKTVKIEEEIIKTVDKVSPAVVSIIVTKDLPKIERFRSDFFDSDFFRRFFGDDDFFGDFFSIPQYEYRQNGTEKKEIGGGTGFIISSDGYIVTNKHVVLDEEAEYTVLTNDEKKYSAKILARDSLNDLAILKIDAKNLSFAELGDSSKLKVGQTAIAIGNALGEFRNTVSVGVISGLSRSIIAGGVGFSENLTGVIQTDASINPGNSGGPLLDISGKVIGINTAIAQGAQGIGFAIPINAVKNSIESVKKTGKIVRPWLGVRYQIINEEIKKANNLKVDYGAIIVRGEKNTDLAVIPGSPADKAGLVENDIILEVNGKKINQENSLATVIGQYKVGDEITLKVMHKGEIKNVKVKLEEMK